MKTLRLGEATWLAPTCSWSKSHQDSTLCKMEARAAKGPPVPWAPRCPPHCHTLQKRPNQKRPGVKQIITSLWENIWMDIIYLTLPMTPGICHPRGYTTQVISHPHLDADSGRVFQPLVWLTPPSRLDSEPSETHNPSPSRMNCWSWAMGMWS